MQIENKKPVIEEPSVPDTIQIPETGAGAFGISIKAVDPQGLLDLKWVGFKALLPDSTEPTSASSVQMFDDGNLDYGDETAFDSVFSRIIYIDETARLGNHTWFFFAEDWVGNSSDTLVKVITVTK